MGLCSIAQALFLATLLYLKIIINFFEKVAPKLGDVKALQKNLIELLTQNSIIKIEKTTQKCGFSLLLHYYVWCR